MGMYYEILTHHGTKLCIDAHTGLVRNCTAAAAGGGMIPLIGYISGPASGVCFLMPGQPIAAAMHLQGNDFAAPIVPLRATAAGAADSVAFYSPRVGRYLIAAPPGADGIGPVATDRSEVHEWERFTLLPLFAPWIPDELAALGQALDFLLRDGLRVGNIMRFLQWEHMDVVWRPVLEAVTSLFDTDQIGCLAGLLRGSPAALASLQRIYADDIDAMLGLPWLCAWLAGQERGQEKPVSAGGRMQPYEDPARLGRELDSLAQRCYHGEYVSLPHACKVALRRSVRPAHELCVIATARNEGIYLLEWIAYYRQLGAEAIFLYSNANSDGSDALLAALHRAGVITWFPSDVAAGGSAQAKAYGHALGLLPDVLDFRWAMICDLDEFLVLDPHHFDSLGDYIAWQESQAVDAIGFNYVEIGSAGQVRWRDEPLVRRFAGRASKPGTAVKTMLRPRKFVHSTPHHPHVYLGRPFVFRSSDRAMHEWEGQLGTAHARTPRADRAWINHYFVKSAEEFLWKWSRNRGDLPFIEQPTNAVLTAHFVRHFMEQHEDSRNSVPSREALAAQRMVTLLDAEIARLAGLPGVAAAAEQVKQAYLARVGGLAELFADAPGVIEAGETGRRFLELFRTAPLAAEPAR